MNCNELSTLAANQIPVIELVFNNTVLGMVRQWQKLFLGEPLFSDGPGPSTDFPLLAKAFGVKALVIEKKADIEPVLREALAGGVPVLIDCRIDRDLNVLPMVPAGESVENPDFRDVRGDLVWKIL